MGASLQQSGTGKSKHAASSEINVTPFVDVMLVLLIIFMVAAPVQTVNVPLDLPEPSDTPQQEEPIPPVIVFLQEDGTVELTGGLLAETPDRFGFDRLPDLAGFLYPRVIKRADGTPDPNAAIVIKAAGNRLYDDVMQVFGAIYSAGYRKAAIIPEEDEAIG